MSELKCCPFCGGEARLYGNSKLIGTKLKHYQVTVCTNDNCGCRTSPCETVEDAIYKWNTRTPMANIVEKLEELPYGRSYHDYAEKGIVHKYLERNDVLDIVKQEIENGLE
jgi:hypothetical protein